MKTATLILEDVKGYAGPANCYRLSEPLFQADHVIVWAQTSFGMQLPEVVVVPSTSSGRARNMDRMPGSCMLHHEADVNDAATLALMLAGGYEIVVPDPVVDDSPAEIDERTIFETEAVKPIRVHALAKELDTTSSELLETLADHGHDITSASANVAPDIADIMRDIYGKGN
ncbi:hypothetical protein AAC389_15600 [Rhodococcus qingshengii]|uniref:hypothetical protein n=1 Tax=Rhodococcus qingshengii TaxID=334542 RepID=UPI00311CCE19